MMGDMIKTSESKSNILLSHVLQNAQEIKYLKDLVSSMKSENADVKNEAKEIRKENTSLREQNLLLGDELHKLQTTTCTLSVEKERLWSDNRELLEEIAQIKDENMRLKSENTENNEILRENTQLRHENDEFKALQTGLSTENEKIRGMNRELWEENKQIRDENVHLKALTNAGTGVPDSESTEVKEINTRWQPVVKTSNRFDALHKEGTDENTDRQAIMRQQASPKIKAHEIEMVFDSHGNELVPGKIYKWRDVGVHVLGKGKKNIAGAQEYIGQLTGTKHVVIGVGSNDLAPTSMSAQQAIDEMTSLLKSIPNASVHLLPAFERIGESKFNDKVREYNNLLSDTVRTFSNVSIIKSGIHSRIAEFYADDKVHFSDKGRSKLVRDIKTHLNPVLGITEYSKYSNVREGQTRTREYDHYGPSNRNQAFRGSPTNHRQNQFGNPVERLLTLLQYV